MKGKKILAFMAMVFLGCGCGKIMVSDANTENAIPEVRSTVSREECCICGESSRSLMPHYRKMDSIGIVCLNTMNISNTEVRGYDDDGTEILDTHATKSLSSSHGDGECRFYIMGTPERGISNVRVSYGENCGPDWEKIREFLCQGCLDQVLDMYREEIEWKGKQASFPEVCLVDFQTNELYSLGSAHVSYYIRDYYIRIDHKEGENDITIFYAPLRVGNGVG